MPGGGGAGRLVDTGLPCRARGGDTAPSGEAESGERSTGTSPALCSMSFCRMGAEISRFLTLLRSGFRGSELYFPPCFSFSLAPASLSATDSDGVLFTPEISFERPDLSAPGSGLCVLSLCLAAMSDSSIRQT